LGKFLSIQIVFENYGQQMLVTNSMTRELKTRLHATAIEGGRRFIVSAAQSQMDFAIRAKRTGLASMTSEGRQATSA
jgi:hypothetical protein